MDRRIFNIGLAALVSLAVIGCGKDVNYSIDKTKFVGAWTGADSSDEVLLKADQIENTVITNKLELVVESKDFKTGEEKSAKVGVVHLKSKNKAVLIYENDGNGLVDADEFAAYKKSPPVMTIQKDGTARVATAIKKAGAANENESFAVRKISEKTLKALGEKLKQAKLAATPAAANDSSSAAAAEATNSGDVSGDGSK